MSLEQPHIEQLGAWGSCRSRPEFDGPRMLSHIVTVRGKGDGATVKNVTEPGRLTKPFKNRNNET